MLLLAAAAKAFPVPRCFVGNISGVYAYRTAYMIFATKLYAQFQPNNEFDVTAVVEPNRNTPVRIVEMERVPLRPIRGSSTRRPPTRAPGTPRTAMMRESR